MDVFEMDASAIKSLISDTYVTIKKLNVRQLHYSSYADEASHLCQIGINDKAKEGHWYFQDTYYSPLYSRMPITTGILSKSDFDHVLHC